MKPLCRRCLLRDMAEQAPLAQLIAEYIAALPEEARADEDTYKVRLAVCGQCDDLLEGTCAHCGCYVEARAAKAGKGCPVGRWGS
ncbi:MAG: DUF6171 family protein [Oscillospiraceae bacterium]|nr:DUF6171 family protein [Oscillospiraceae bacterium]